MAPRKNQRLRYVKLDRLGRLTYSRVIPPKLQAFLGGKTVIRRSLGTTATDCSDPAVMAAYSQVHGEIDGLITQAKAKLAGVMDAIAVDTAAITPHLERFPLSQRAIAGIAGQVWINLRHAVEHQQNASPELSRSIVGLAIKAQTEGDAAITVADFSAMARPILNDLGISPSPVDMEKIGAALLAYFPQMQADMRKLQQLDYSPPRLKEISPPLPTRAVTWEQLFEGWLLSTGGITEVDGYGVSKKRQGPYQTAIREFRQSITNDPPAQLTIEQARQWVRWLQTDSGYAPGTQRVKLLCLSNMCKIGVNDGVISHNPFNQFKISTPAGAIDQSGYRSFTQQELIRIFTVVKRERTTHHHLIPWILLTTGCRLSEAVQLRTHDIKQTASGVWFFDWKHEPLAEYPMMLKSRSDNNRMCPMHPRLLDTGILKLDRSYTGRLFPNVSQHTASHSKHFQQLLQAQGIWEKKKTCYHSFRNNAKEFWREAGIPIDYRNAFTGHQAIGAGEQHYGKLLNDMPDQMNEQLIKIDLSWLP